MGVRFNTSAITESSSAVGRELAKPSGGSHGAALRWSARFLVAASWISGAIFPPTSSLSSAAWRWAELVSDGTSPFPIYTMAAHCFQRQPSARTSWLGPYSCCSDLSS